MKGKLICIFLGLTSMLTHAQHTNFNIKKNRINWSLYKKEVFFGGGITQFRGDLGGVNKLSSDNKLSDLTWPSAGWQFLGGYRFRFHPNFITTSVLQVGQLRGNDALKIDPYQNSRNLHFRSMHVQFSQRMEFLLLANEIMRRRHTIRPPVKIPLPGNETVGRRYALKPQNEFNYKLYSFAGLGLMYYNPKARYNDSWVELQPLSTEGQGLPGGRKPYRRITASVPVGMGFCWGFSRMWRIGIEADYTFTFSDYLDDVGGVYYDQDQLAAQIGEASAYLSNPSIQNTELFETGMARGDNRLDGFFSVTLILKRNVTYKWCYTKKDRERKESFKNIQ